MRSQFQIGLPDVTFRNLQFLIADGDRRFYFFVTGEREVINRIEALGLAFLKNEVQAAQRAASGALAGEAVLYALGLFTWKPSRHILFGIGIRDDIDHLRLVLQWPNN